MIVRQSSDASATAFAQRADVADLVGSGPATPDHVLRTKRIPLLGRDVEAFAQAYRAYFDEHAGPDSALEMLDPAPRVVVDPELGVLAVGPSAAGARMVDDIYSHTVQIVSRAAALESWQALPRSDIFDVEYWELEQAKLGRAGTAPPFTGEVVAITGAASGIGKACAEAFLAEGAAVVALDRDPAVRTLWSDDAVLGLRCDVTDRDQVRSSLGRRCSQLRRPRHARRERRSLPGGSRDRVARPRRVAGRHGRERRCGARGAAGCVPAAS